MWNGIWVLGVDVYVFFGRWRGLDFRGWGMIWVCFVVLLENLVELKVDYFSCV